MKQALGGQEITTVHELDNGDMIQAMVPIRDGEQVAAAMVVAIHVTQRLEARLRNITQAFQEYKQLRLLKNPIKGIYILLFLLMTLIIVFSATWFGLYLARGITEPIQMLAEGTREVAAGNLAYKVQVRADDEIGILVDSFNRMTGDLAASQSKLEETYRDLQAKHTEMEERRRYTETVLEAVATGVVSLDPDGRVTTINGAAERLLGLHAAEVQGRPAARVFRSPEYVEIDALIQRMGRVREGMLDREVHLRRDGQAVALLASATALRGPDGGYVGMVLAFDDLTELLKAQRLAAWREVAQRIAHEIKNPLTPIQLSAQRLRRRLASDRSPDEKRLLDEATGTIIQEVEGLRQLVDEFSRFARMPALTPKPTDLARLLEGVVVLYRESHPSLAIRAVLLARPAARRGRPRPDQARGPQPGGQRGGGGGRHRRGRGADGLAPRGPPGPHRGGRRRARHLARRPRPALRALLLHQGHRHGARAADRPPDRLRPRRHDPGRGQHAARQPLRHRAARRAPGGRAGAGLRRGSRCRASTS